MASKLGRVNGARLNGTKYHEAKKTSEVFAANEIVPIGPAGKVFGVSRT
jgi:hypothetical protein